MDNIHIAEWWINEDGGEWCSNCGLFYDDYYTMPPNVCPQCNSNMTNETNMIVDRRYRLSSVYSAYFEDESTYPDWLQHLRKEFVKRHKGEEK